ncbi:MAG: hypothetical protein LBG59_00980 [Candidatus Peribacteria bacterium]|nr:hypothetical protein [Candidatus Peribacteria bacterium]
MLGVSQPLDNPVSRDGYLLIQNPMNMVNTYATTQNYANEAKKVEDLQQSLTALSDVKETSRNEKDILIGNEIEVFLDQHHKFWLTVEMVLKQIISVANQLFMNR